MTDNRQPIEKKITLYEADLYDAPEVKEATVQVVVFRLAGEWYGVEITKVKEVQNRKNNLSAFQPGTYCRDC